MFDTVKIISPILSEYVTGKYQEFCIKRTGVEIQSGEVMYEFTSGQLKGSFDHRIGIKVRVGDNPKGLALTLGRVQDRLASPYGLPARGATARP